MKANSQFTISKPCAKKSNTIQTHALTNARTLIPENTHTHTHILTSKRFAKKRNNVNNIYGYTSDSEDKDPQIGLAGWSRNKETIVCQWVKNTGKEERYDFDINKADRIFDLLLQEKHTLFSF
jgi:hypothetical protein